MSDPKPTKPRQKPLRLATDAKSFSLLEALAYPCSILIEVTTTGEGAGPFFLTRPEMRRIIRWMQRRLKRHDLPLPLTAPAAEQTQGGDG